MGCAQRFELTDWICYVPVAVCLQGDKSPVWESDTSLGPVGVCADATAILQRLSSIKADAAAAAADSPASSAAGAADAAESRAKAEKALQQLEAAKLRVVQGRVTSPDGVLVSDVSVNL